MRIGCNAGIVTSGLVPRRKCSRPRRLGNHNTAGPPTRTNGNKTTPTGSGNKTDDMKDSETDLGILFSFGLVSDIQYAGIEDRFNLETTKWRRYRHSLSCLREAVKSWKSENLAFVTQLGDIIDGFNREDNNSEEALRAVLGEFQHLPSHFRLVNVMGNHELYNFPRTDLGSLYGNGPITVDQLNTLLENDSVLNSTALPCQQNTATSSGRGGLVVNVGTSDCQQDGPAFYYTFVPHPHFRVVVLDSFDLSILGRDESSARYREALEFVAQRNKNIDLEDPSGLEGLDRRFTVTNGAVGKQQLVWLETVLAAADKESEKVIILSHVPFNPRSCDAACLLCNYQDVLDVIQKSSCVVCCFYGHDHGASHVVDSGGIHYFMIQAMVEALSNSNCFAMVHVKEGEIIIEGYGKLASCIFKC